MSHQYKTGDHIPTEVLAARLNELSDAVTKGEAGLHEFYMRIPAERDRDADLVLHEAANRLRELEAVAAQCKVTTQNNGDGSFTHVLRFPVGGE